MFLKPVFKLVLTAMPLLVIVCTFPGFQTHILNLNVRVFRRKTESQPNRHSILVRE